MMVLTGLVQQKCGKCAGRSGGRVWIDTSWNSGGRSVRRWEEERGFSAVEGVEERRRSWGCQRRIAIG